MNALKYLMVLLCIGLLVVIGCGGSTETEVDVEASMEAMVEDEHAVIDSIKGRFPINYTGFTHTG